MNVVSSGMGSSVFLSEETEYECWLKIDGPKVARLSGSLERLWACFSAIIVCLCDLLLRCIGLLNPSWQSTFCGCCHFIRFIIKCLFSSNDFRFERCGYEFECLEKVKSYPDDGSCCCLEECWRKLACDDDFFRSISVLVENLSVSWLIELAEHLGANWHWYFFLLEVYFVLKIMLGESNILLYL